MSNEGKIRVPVTDKNGKLTHVWKTPEEIKNSGKNIRHGIVPTINAASPKNPEPSVDNFGSMGEGQDSLDFSGQWKQTIDLRALSHPDLNLQDRAEIITSQLSDSQWMKDNDASGDSELSDNLEAIQDAAAEGDASRFDVAWNNVYNLADVDGIWLDTA